MDKPENEHKKLIQLSFIGIDKFDVAIKLQPLVISILPRNNE